MGLTLLRAVPLWAWALVAALLWGGWQYRRAESAGAELLRIQAETATLREGAMHQALIETTRRLKAQQEAADAAETAASAARADATAAAAPDQPACVTRCCRYISRCYTK
jgi:hypothetical protein